MEQSNKFSRASWQIMEQLLEVDDLFEALSGSLEIIVKTLNSEAGAIWYLDPKTGESLMKVGLPVSLGDKDYDSAVFELAGE